jgi:predicted DNA-binding transcriptional regulator YafY
MMGVMDKPIQRILAALELLQANATITGSELASRIGVERRTVRRYVIELEKLGVPIRATRGRDGGYALMPGYKLPPMMFTNDEALAVAIGLRIAREIGLSDMSPAVAGAQAKLDRVAPSALQKRIGNLGAVVAFELPRPPVIAASAHFALLTTAAAAAQRLVIHYCAVNGAVSIREINPYGVGYSNGAWYAVGYCHSRCELRCFRVDRMQKITAVPRTFARPVDFDLLLFLHSSLAKLPREHKILVHLDTNFATARNYFPAHFGKLSRIANGTQLEVQIDDVHWFARELARLPCKFQIQNSPALEAALSAHAEELLQLLAR